MATLDSDIVDALNMLLEDVRASVEIEVALSNGATEYLEREALTAMGVEDILIAFLLRDWLESFDLPVTRRINGIVLQALDLTRYDDRLSLFLHHQLASRDQAVQLLDEADLNSAGEEILRSIVDAHTRHAAWSEERAREFAETRQLEFRRPNGHPLGAADSDPLTDPPGSSSPSNPSSQSGAPDAPDASGGRSSSRAASLMAEQDDEDDEDDEPDIEDAIVSPESPPAE
jgi:hypothetical protein